MHAPAMHAWFNASHAQRRRRRQGAEAGGMRPILRMREAKMPKLRIVSVSGTQGRPYDNAKEDDFDRMHKKMQRLRLRGSTRRVKLTPEVRRTLREATQPRSSRDRRNDLHLTSSRGQLGMSQYQRALYRLHWRGQPLPVETNTD